MKNNKGMTIVEIIVSLVLISVILIFLMNLLITVQNYSIQDQNATDLLINKAVITKAIEKDMNEYKLSSVGPCLEADLTKTRRYPLLPNSFNNLYCLKLTFADESLDESEGFLIAYSYNYATNAIKNVIGYKRGSNQTIRETKVLMNPSEHQGIVTSSCNSANNDNCSLKITLPVVDSLDNHYDIVATYIYKNNEFSYTLGEAYGFKIQ